MRGDRINIRSQWKLNEINETAAHISLKVKCMSSLNVSKIYNYVYESKFEQQASKKLNKMFVCCSLRCLCFYTSLQNLTDYLYY